MSYIVAFIVLLGALVFFHELGHFFFARLFGVGVTTFSLGFGPKIVSWRRGGTEYRISWVPLGGYVKMVGEDPSEEIPEEQKRVSFAHKPVWQRAVIVFAGPFSNVVLAFAIFAAVLTVGLPRLQPVVGTVEPDSPAARAGLAPGDRITAVDGVPTATWDEMEQRIDGGGGAPVTLRIEREGTVREATVSPARASRPDIFGRPRDGWSIGISSAVELPYVGISDPSSLAARSGLLSGDRITKVDGREVQYRYQLIAALAERSGRPVVLEVRRERPDALTEDEVAVETISLTMVLPEFGEHFPGLAALGIEDPSLYVLRVLPDSPAAAAGFRRGDKIVAIDGRPPADTQEFLVYIRKSAGKDARVTVRRDGQDVEIRVVPRLERRETETGGAEQAGKIGILIGVSRSRGVMGLERHWNPLRLFPAAAGETWLWAKTTAQAFYYIATGQLSPRSLGGPLRIAELAGETARTGLFNYLFLIAVISMNLAVINLVPMPVLDGGHLLLLSIEAALRRPLRLRTLQVVHYVGLAFLVLLIVFIFYNDITYFFPGLQGPPAP